MTQGFAKKNSFSSVYLDNLCKFYSGEVTVTGGGGDVTVNLPFDWTGGWLRVIQTTFSSEWADADNAYMREVSYDSLTNSNYTIYQTLYNASNGLNGWCGVATKTDNVAGLPKSATSTTFVLNDDSSNTVYIKYFVWAPYTATLQMDGSNIILTGTSAPSSTPEFIGQKYINETNKIEYTAFGTLSSVDWQPQAGTDSEGAYNFAKIDGILTKVYTKYLTGILDSDSLTLIDHNISDYNKIINCNILVGNISSTFNVKEMNRGSDSSYKWEVYITSTQIGINDVGSYIQGQKYRIKIEYYL